MSDTSGERTDRRQPSCAVCARLRAALRRVLLDNRWSEVDSARVAGVARVPAAEFGTHFPTLVACAADALDESAQSCLAACALARDRLLPDHQQYLRFVSAVVSWAHGDPGMARMLFVLPEESGEVLLGRRLAIAVARFVALFESTMPHLPAGSTQTEFVIGLFYRMMRQALSTPGGIAMVPKRVRALGLFVDGRANARP